MDRKEYMKAYRQTAEYKEANKLRMAKKNATEEGKAYEHKKSRSARSRYTRCRQTAVKRDLEFSLGFEFFKQLMESQICHYCNDSFAEEGGYCLDRIDNDRGYLEGNVLPCCADCNRRRNRSMSSEEFKRQTKLNGRWKE